jgi:hypothetical protein
MRYFFHFEGQSNVEDSNGEHFASDEEALTKAHLIANELASDIAYGQVRLISAKGKQIAVIPLH